MVKSLIQNVCHIAKCEQQNTTIMNVVINEDSFNDCMAHNLKRVRKSPRCVIRSTVRSHIGSSKLAFLLVGANLVYTCLGVECKQVIANKTERQVITPAGPCG
ncbi:hypothetical protein VCUG_01734 [Vavraia culicis subsp. floridensis]|uniref:Uncharacterized protein n=1 Tax=Vavraia culicis (isolate floridensis) TaxID=948595 RepID=L2GUJ6_VAVCU|nr:uncharacterized protein VCUG_01734 [Vavraia culicis subsp. floridensis]ELA46775.1 hypothetical protein VCUG_01734 [Vavraia culicis subsp. floridensis]